MYPSACETRRSAVSQPVPHPGGAAVSTASICVSACRRVTAPDRADPTGPQPAIGVARSTQDPRLASAVATSAPSSPSPVQSRIERLRGRRDAHDEREPRNTQPNRHIALRDAGLLEYALRLEYPIAGALQPETLLTGYLDLLAASASELVIVDFKTDPPPSAAVGITYPGYVSQVRTYQQLIEATALADQRRVRGALLFTADGALHWV